MTWKRNQTRDLNAARSQSPAAGMADREQLGCGSRKIGGGMGRDTWGQKGRDVSTAAAQPRPGRHANTHPDIPATGENPKDKGGEEKPDRCRQQQCQSADGRSPSPRTQEELPPRTCSIHGRNRAREITWCWANEVCEAPSPPVPPQATRLRLGQRPQHQNRDGQQAWLPRPTLAT